MVCYETQHGANARGGSVHVSLCAARVSGLQYWEASMELRGVKVHMYIRCSSVMYMNMYYQHVY